MFIKQIYNKFKMNNELPLEERAKILLRQKMSGTISRDPIKDRTLGEEVTYLIDKGYVREVETHRGLRFFITLSGRGYIS